MFSSLRGYDRAWRPESGLFFGNADAIRRAIQTAAGEPGVRAVVIDAETVPFIDVTAARTLAGLAAVLHERGVTLALARDVGQVRDVLRADEHQAGAIASFPSVREAVRAVSGRPGTGGHAGE
jgi:sulfate permease, SulP family